jgi:hypothetical protein
MITLYGSAVAAVVSVAVGWNQLDLPTPATTAELQEVQQYAANTRAIVLNQEWFRLQAQLIRAENALQKAPHNRSLQEDVARIRAALRRVEADLKKVQ